MVARRMHPGAVSSPAATISTAPAIESLPSWLRARPLLAFSPARERIEASSVSTRLAKGLCPGASEIYRTRIIILFVQFHRLLE